jgi:hypothetical protein
VGVSGGHAAHPASSAPLPGESLLLRPVGYHASSGNQYATLEGLVGGYSSMARRDTTHCSAASVPSFARSHSGGSREALGRLEGLSPADSAVWPALGSDGCSGAQDWEPTHLQQVWAAPPGMQQQQLPAVTWGGGARVGQPPLPSNPPLPPQRLSASAAAYPPPPPRMAAPIAA